MGGFAKAPDLGPRLLKSSSHEVAGFILTILHCLTYLPLVLVPAMQDAHLRLVLVLNTSLCLCLMVGNMVFSLLGIVKVFPKMLDTFLLALYASMVPVAYLQFAWLSECINMFNNGAVAAFVWLTVLLPWWDSFGMEALKDRLSPELWDLPVVKATANRISIVWGIVFTLSTISAVPPVLLTERYRWAAVHILCDYVVMFVLLGLGGTVQWVSMRRLLAAHHLLGPPQQGGSSSIRASSSASSSSSGGGDLEACVATISLPQQGWGQQQQGQQQGQQQLRSLQCSSASSWWQGLGRWRFNSLTGTSTAAAPAVALTATAAEVQDVVNSTSTTNAAGDCCVRDSELGQTDQQTARRTTPSKGVAANTSKPATSP